MTHTLNSLTHRRKIEGLILGSTLRPMVSKPLNWVESFYHSALPKVRLHPRPRHLCEDKPNPERSLPPSKQSTSQERVKPDAPQDCGKTDSDRESNPNVPETLTERMNLFMDRLDEQQRRWFVALVAEQLGRGGVQKMSQITGMHPDTIRRGKKELEAGLADRPKNRIRQAGGGRPAKSSPKDKEKKNNKTREE